MYTILMITCIVFWLASIWLYFFFDRLLDDVRAISKDLDEIRADFKECQRDFDTLRKEAKSDIPNDEFLGI